ncbi:uncharacterized protein LOC128322183 [Hemicordylus capensis]|uniref:uncharacterized protein LOC128322183 n=1 Tax=Hemicordylus capensis TaxID=884348 RepID=UPI0023031B0B|nr:uncharacterized protein LOC128322183 [Hemicordylus capensis]
MASHHDGSADPRLGTTGGLPAGLPCPEAPAAAAGGPWRPAQPRRLASGGGAGLAEHEAALRAGEEPSIGGPQKGWIFGRRRRRRRSSQQCVQSRASQSSAGSQRGAPDAAPARTAVSPHWRHRSTIFLLLCHLKAVMGWMRDNNLRLNPNETELPHIELTLSTSCPPRPQDPSPEMRVLGEPRTWMALRGAWITSWRRSING